jgi:hypothetical protein
MESLMASGLLLQARNFLDFEVSGGHKSCWPSDLHAYRYRTSEYSVNKRKCRFTKYLLREQREFVQLREMRFQVILIMQKYLSHRGVISNGVFSTPLFQYWRFAGANISSSLSISPISDLEANASAVYHCGLRLRHLHCHPDVVLRLGSLLPIGTFRSRRIVDGMDTGLDTCCRCGAANPSNVPERLRLMPIFISELKPVHPTLALKWADNQRKG